MSSSNTICSHLRSGQLLLLDGALFKGRCTSRANCSAASIMMSSSSRLRFIRLLDRLAKAPALSTFALTIEETALFQEQNQSKVVLAFHNQEVLQACFTTLAHGCSLFLTECQQEWANDGSSTVRPAVDGLATLRDLFLGLTWCLSSAPDTLNTSKFSEQCSELSLSTGQQPSPLCSRCLGARSSRC